ncbi:hypothetical protein Tco_0611438 [Tanacetum coccineum]
MPPPSYRGCWHGVSRGFFLESCHDRALDERALQAALPFFTHAILLDRAFAHCPRFPTAAPRGSPGRVSVPVWLIIRKDQLSIIGLLPENNVRLACVKHIASVPSEPGSNSSFDYDLALQCLVIDILEKLVKSRQTLSKAMVARNGFSQVRKEKARFNEEGRRGTQVVIAPLIRIIHLHPSLRGIIKGRGRKLIFWKTVRAGPLKQILTSIYEPPCNGSCVAEIKYPSSESEQTERHETDQISLKAKQEPTEKRPYLCIRAASFTSTYAQACQTPPTPPAVSRRDIDIEIIACVEPRGALTCAEYSILHRNQNKLKERDSTRSALKSKQEPLKEAGTFRIRASKATHAPGASHLAIEGQSYASVKKLSSHRCAVLLILSLEMRVPSIDIYHRIRNPSMDEKVELQYRLRWLSQGSISKVPQSMVDASLELYPIPYSMLKLLCLSEPKKKAGRLGSYAKPEKKNLLSIFELRIVYFIFRPGKPMTLQVRAFDSAKWRPVLPEYSAVASIVRNASDHLRPFLMMDPPATLEALVRKGSYLELTL